MQATGSIDSLGNVLDKDGQYIGFYDEGQCYDFDNNSIPCPEEPKNVETPTVEAKQTYWWVAIVGLLLATALGLYIYSNTKS